MELADLLIADGRYEIVFSHAFQECGVRPTAAIMRIVEGWCCKAIPERFNWRIPVNCVGMGVESPAESISRVSMEELV